MKNTTKKMRLLIVSNETYAVVKEKIKETSKQLEESFDVSYTTGYNGKIMLSETYTYDAIIFVYDNRTIESIDIAHIIEKKLYEWYYGNIVIFDHSFVEFNFIIKNDNIVDIIKESKVFLVTKIDD